MSEIARLERDKRRARNKNNLREEANLSNLLGQKLQEAGDLEGALEQHREEAALCESLGDTIGYAVSHRRMGEVLCEMGQWEEALRHQSRHLTLAKEAENLVEEQRAHATLGRTHLHRAEALICSGQQQQEGQALALTEAERAFLRSLSTCERLKGAVDTREHSQMRCRLYLNLGLVLDYRGRSKKACDFIGQALEQCYSHSLHEDAQRCHSALAAIRLREGLLPQALQEGQKSLDLSARLHDRALQCEGHSFLAQVHLASVDFEAAKKCLYRAHRLKHPDPAQRRRTETNLKAVVRLCGAEDSLITEEAEDEKLKLYEKLGDGLADLSLYSQALGYYHKMLELALRLDKGLSFLAPVYLSLARTYSDNKQFEEAKTYYLKEYDIRLKEDPSEACKTLISIANTSEELKDTFETLSPLYEQARGLAEKGNNPKLEVCVLRLHSSLEGIATSMKEDLEAKMKRLIEENDLDPEALSEDEEEEEEEEGKRSDGESSVDLDLIHFTDSDNEQENFDRPQRQRKTFVVRKNEKGESPLHRACIAGNLALVKSLLRQGHPVNLRDNCGWLPLHEASNHGYYDVVLALIEGGAWVNDRGGQHCEGVTPLHDASSCGNLEVVRLLVSKGASVVCKTNHGDTPLECLVKYRMRTKDLSPGEVEECVVLEKELEERMERAGHRIPSCDQEVVGSARSGVRNGGRKMETSHSNDNEAETTMARYQKSIGGREAMSDSVDGESDEEYDSPHSQEGPSSRSRGDSDEECELPNPLLEDLLHEKRSATGTYLSAISSVGSAARRVQLHKSSSPSGFKKDKKSSAFLSQDSVGEDWLEDDMGIFTKKRKRQEKSEFEYKEERREKRAWAGSKMSRPKKSRQTKLTSIFQSYGNRDVSEEEDVSVVDAVDATSEPGVATSEAKGSEASAGPASVSQALRLRVRVESRLLLVPVAGTGHDRTVGWLADEVTRRYYQLAGLRPHLTLTTQDGAVLDPNDPISLVLPKDQAELKGQVTGWDLPPLPDRYSQACQTLGRVPEAPLTSVLQRTEASATLDVSRMGRLTAQHLQPVLRSLQCQKTLRSLVLSHCRLGDDGFQHLMDALPSLPSLDVLHLRASAITTPSLLEFAEAVASAKLPLKALTSLDMSYNALSGAKASNVGALMDLPSLAVLTLKHCGFDMTAEQHQLTPTTSSLKTLSLDYNSIRSVALASLLSRVPKISTLTLSGLKCKRDSAGSAGLGEALSGVLGAGEECHLQHLDVSACNLANSDLEDISAYLYRCPHLISVNLSHNPGLTAPSLNALLDELTSNIALPLTALSIHGIRSDLGDKVTSTLQHKSATKHAMKKLSLTAMDNAKDVEDFWRTQYQHRASVKRIGSEVFLSRDEN